MYSLRVYQLRLCNIIKLHSFGSVWGLLTYSQQLLYLLTFLFVSVLFLSLYWVTSMYCKKLSCYSYSMYIQWRSVDYRCLKRTVILPPPKVVRCLMPPYHHNVWHYHPRFDVFTLFLPLSPPFLPPLLIAAQGGLSLPPASRYATVYIWYYEIRSVFTHCVRFRATHTDIETGKLNCFTLFCA